jgi:hypothetical protein
VWCCSPVCVHCVHRISHIQHPFWCHVVLQSCLCPLCSQVQSHSASVLMPCGVAVLFVSTVFTGSVTLDNHSDAMWCCSPVCVHRVHRVSHVGHPFWCHVVLQSYLCPLCSHFAASWIKLVTFWVLQWKAMSEVDSVSSKPLIRFEAYCLLSRCYFLWLILWHCRQSQCVPPRMFIDFNGLHSSITSLKDSWNYSSLMFHGTNYVG